MPQKFILRASAVATSIHTITCENKPGESGPVPSRPNSDIATWLRSLLLICLLPSMGGAWEADFHYGLTKWLAIKAGFNPKSAEEVAKYVQFPDDGVFLPATYASIHLFAADDEGASTEIRNLHFPSDVDVPAPHDRRTVQKGGTFAWARVRAEIGRDVTTASPDQLHDNLKDFGMGIHLLQDSWSHQGVPDSPFRPVVEVSTGLSWAHPEARFGWPFHDSDLTYRFPSDAVEAARATFKALKMFLERKGADSWGKPSDTEWGEISPAVFRFARAKNKREKADWFAKELLEAPISREDATAVSQNHDEETDSVIEFYLSKCSLPGIWRVLRKTGPFKPIQPTSRPKSGRAPESANAFMRQFLTTWIVHQRIDEAVMDIDLAALKEEVDGLRRLGDDSPLFAEPIAPPILTASERRLVSKATRAYGFSPEQKLILSELVADRHLDTATAEAVSTEMAKWRLNREQAGALADRMEEGPIPPFERMAAVKSIRKAEIREPETLLWAKKFLTSWLVIDHGLVDLRGHSIPGTDGYLSLPEAPTESKDGFEFGRVESLATAIRSPFPDEPFHIEAVDPKNPFSSGRFVATFKFIDKPYDVLYIDIAPHGRKWKVVGMYWIAG